MSSRHLVVGAAAVAVGVVAWKLLRSQRSPPRGGNGDGPMTVTQLWCYPVKSCSGQPLTEAVVTNTGIEYDREWVVVRKEDNLILKQVQYPTLKRVLAVVNRLTGTVQISAEGHGSVEIPLRAEDVSSIPLERIVDLEKGKMKGTFAKESDEVSKWFSDFLGVEVFVCRCYVARNPNHYIQEQYSKNAHEDDRVQGQDFSSMHVVTEESMAWTRQKCGDPTINSARFRANIVVQGGCAFPDEDHWVKIMVGHIPLRFGRPTLRCPMITMDDDGSLHPDNEPTATLKRLRPTILNKVIFGLNMFHEDIGTIRVGDPVAVVERQEKGLEGTDAA